MAPSAVTLAAGAIFFLLQPLVMILLVIGKPRPHNVAALSIFLLGTCAIAHRLSTEMEPCTEASVLWYPFAMQAVRYTHAVAVGGEHVAKLFGLTSYPRVSIYILSPPTVIFADGDGAATGGAMANTRLRWLKTLLGGLLQMVLAVILARIVLILDLDRNLPELGCRILVCYCHALTMGATNIIFDAPVQFFLGNRVAIYDCNYWPVLALSMRNLWQRMTLSAGYLFRKGFYEPLGGRSSAMMAATIAPFAVNSVLHVYIWGYWIQFRAVYEFVHLLITLPLTLFFFEEYILSRHCLRSSWLYGAINYCMLLLSAYWIAPLFGRAQLLPTELRGVALNILGRKDETEMV